MYVLCLAAFVWFADEPSVVRIEVRPIDFQDEENPDSFVTGITHLDTDGVSLFIAPHMEPSLLQVSGEVRFIRRFGRKGRGPGELGSFGLTSISVREGRFWLVDGQLRAHYFEGGEFQLSWKLESYYIRPSISGAHTMAFDRDHVVIPVHPSTGHLAAVYNYGGERVRYLGRILPIDHELLMKNRGLNDTHWAHDGQFWYCLFRFWPRLLVFDAQFRQIREFEVSGPEVAIRQGMFFGDIEPNYKGFIPPFFKDFKVLGEHLYFLCHDALYQLDKSTLQTLKRYKFFGTTADFRRARNYDLHPEFFAVLRSGKVLLGWGIALYDHDLLIGDLP